MKRTFVTAKKTFAIALALLMILSAAAMGEGVSAVNDYATARGFDVAVDPDGMTSLEDGSCVCADIDMTIGSEPMVTTAVIWSEGGHTYTVTGMDGGFPGKTVAEAKQLFLDILPMHDWRVCSYGNSEKILFAYAAPDVDVAEANADIIFDDLGQYIDTVTEYISYEIGMPIETAQAEAEAPTQAEASTESSAPMAGISEGMVLLDQDGIKVYCTGVINFDNDYSDEPYLEIEVVFENDSDRPAGISIDDAYANGWKIYCGSISAVAPGKKSKSTIDIDLEDSDVKALEDIQEIELSGHVYDDESYHTLFGFGPIVINMQ